MAAAHCGPLSASKSHTDCLRMGQAWWATAPQESESPVRHLDAASGRALLLLLPFTLPRLLRTPTCRARCQPAAPDTARGAPARFTGSACTQAPDRGARC